MTKEQYKLRRERLISYMLMKIEAGNDWHAVADCAMDLRDLDEYYKGYNAALEAAKANNGHE